MRSERWQELKPSAEIAVHSGGVESAWIAIAESLKGLVVLGSSGQDSAVIIDGGVDDNKDGGILDAGDLKFA